jgi:hypothetical protein
MYARRVALLGFVVALALGVAGCSSGGKHAAPTTSAPTSATALGVATRVPGGGTGPLDRAATLGPCPMHFPIGLLSRLNTGVQGLDKTLVPIVASKVRICQYDVGLPKTTGPVGLTGPQSEVIGTVVLTSAASARLGTQVDAFPRFSSASSSLPGCGGPTYHAEYFLLTFANHADNVDVEEDNTRCDPLSNGTLRANPSSSWINELQRYTTPTGSGSQLGSVQRTISEKAQFSRRPREDSNLRPTD